MSIVSLLTLVSLTICRIKVVHSSQFAARRSSQNSQSSSSQFGPVSTNSQFSKRFRLVNHNFTTPKFTTSTICRRVEKHATGPEVRQSPGTSKESSDSPQCATRIYRGPRLFTQVLSIRLHADPFDMHTEMTVGN